MINFKKAATAAVVIGAMSITFLASAQTAPSSLESLIAQLQSQIATLKAQIEAVRNSKLSSSIDQLETPGAKRGRKMGGGQKGAAKREETRVEKPVPPSG